MSAWMRFYVLVFFLASACPAQGGLFQNYGKGCSYSVVYMHGLKSVDLYIDAVRWDPLSSTWQPEIPRIGSGFCVCTEAIASVSPVLLIGVSNTSWNGIPLPMTVYRGGVMMLSSTFYFTGPCLLTSVEVIVPAISTNGRICVDLRIPLDPALVGATVYMQFVINWTAPTMSGFYFGKGYSNGGMARIGR